MALTCSNCGKELPDDARFCSECGTGVAVEEKKPDYCANCFAELSEGAKFCLQCGKPATPAMAYLTWPDKDQSIYDELKASTPQEIHYRAYEIAHANWEQHPSSYPEPRLNTNDIIDFDKNKEKIRSRASKWARYEASGMERIHVFQYFADWWLHMADEAWSREMFEFQTNKPNYHKALFYEEVLDFWFFTLRQQYAITYDDPPQLTPMFLDYLRKVKGYSDQYIQDWQEVWQEKLSGMDEIKQWPQKDDELFQPPQPVTYEAAGGIISFTTDEAVVIVYLDCMYKGHEIELKSVQDEELYVWTKATIIERTSGNIPICVAIFPPILFATDLMKNREKVINQLKVEISASWSADNEISSEEAQKLRDENKIMWFDSSEQVVLFKGNVTPIDWRGKRGKVKSRSSRW